MPLSERAKSESSKPKMTNGLSDPSYMSEEHVELQWDNGQIVKQGQTHRVRKNTFSVAESQVIESRGGSLHKIGHFSGMESPLANEPHIELHAQVDDIVPWINYPIEDSLQNDYCSELLNELSTATLNSLAAQNKIIPSLSSITAQVVSDSHHLEELEASKFVTENSVKKGIRTSQPLQLAHESHFSIPSANSRVTYMCARSAIKAHQGPNGSSKTSRLQKPEMGGLCTSVMNFSHFSRAATLAKAHLQCDDRLASKEKASTSNPLISTLTESNNVFKKTIVSQGQLDVVPMREEQRSTARPIKEAICREGASNKNNATDVCDRVPDQIQNESFAANTAYEKKENETVCLPVASSSVCSGSSTGAASNDPKPSGKRKHCEGEESGYLSEDVEDESVDVKKAVTDRGPVPKRSRAAEVHNLSERRRRDRINERMRALQQLIPNCNKADKASMLDEAIEYLKSLQLQVQMMSMASSLFVPPIMLPPGMQQLPSPSMANFYTLGVGMGMNNGMGMYDTKGIPSFPNMPFPNMHGPQFPCSSIPGMAGLRGMAGTADLQMFGISGHGFPMAMMPSQPLFDPSGLAKMENVLHASPAGPSSSSSSDKLQQTLNLNTMQKRCPPDSQEVKKSLKEGLTTAEDRQLDPH